MICHLCESLRAALSFQARQSSGRNRRSTSSVWQRSRDARDCSPHRTRIEPLESRSLMAGLVISEIQYAPHGSNAGLGESEYRANDFEFIELLNAGQSPLDLSQFRLAPTSVNGTTEGISFTFPQSTLPAGQRVVVVRNAAAFRARHGDVPNLVGEWSGGNLANSGETLTVLDATGAVAFQVRYDSNSDWPYLADGRGASLEIVDPAADPNVPTNWRDSHAFGGSPGLASTAPFSPRVLINEVLAHTDEPLLDAIELRNLTNAPVDIGGWFLTDQLDNLKFMVPAGTRIPAGGYFVFDERQFNPGLGTRPNDLGISELGETLWLISPGNARRPRIVEDTVVVAATENSVSVGNIRDDRDSRQLVRLATRSLGAPNGAPLTSPIIIREVHYHPADDDVYKEFIELKNVTANPVDVSDWQLTDAVDFSFPAGTTVPAGGLAILVAFDPRDAARAAAFRGYFGMEENVPLFGPWSTNSRGEPDRLSDRGETVSLRYPLIDQSGVHYGLAESVSYTDTDPWPMTADAEGASLVRVNTSGYSRVAANWAAAHPSPGDRPFQAWMGTWLPSELPVGGDIGRDEAFVRGGTDVDYFRFQAPADGEYVFRVRSTNAESAAPELALFSPTRNLISQAATGGNDSARELSVRLTADNWYIPVVSGAGSVGAASDLFSGIGMRPGAIGPYEIVVSMPSENEPSQHNVALPADVNGDAVVSPFDALLVINYLNEVAANPDKSPATNPSQAPFPDVNNDRTITPMDALMVINHLNLQRSAISQPVAAVPTGVPDPAIVLDWRLTAIAAAVDHVFAEDSATKRP